jgi:hypothetical protein
VPISATERHPQCLTHYSELHFILANLGESLYAQPDTAASCEKQRLCPLSLSKSLAANPGSFTLAEVSLEIGKTHFSCSVHTDNLGRLTQARTPPPHWFRSMLAMQHICMAHGRRRLPINSVDASCSASLRVPSRVHGLF